MKTNVKLRETNEEVTVDITSKGKPTITKDILHKWQKIIDNVAEIFDVPSALIMKITTENMEVFLKSSNPENPYPIDGKDSLGHGLYCETVIGTNKSLHIDNSLKYEKWRDNPDVKLDMISYYGLPIQWTDGETFGTICVLDNKTNDYDMRFKKFLSLMKELIEDDLKLILLNQKLEELSIKDDLTKSYNRRYAMQYLSMLKEEYLRYQRPFSIIMIDFNGFKAINDQFGHQVGDRVLRKFSDIVSSVIRKVDVLARLGGDEFVVICKETDEEHVKVVVDKIDDAISKDTFLGQYELCFSSGTAEYQDHLSIDELLSIADEKMYEQKSTYKSK